MVFSNLNDSIILRSVWVEMQGCIGLVMATSAMTAWSTMFQKRANERISYHQTRRDAREGGMPKQEQSKKRCRWQEWQQSREDESLVGCNQGQWGDAQAGVRGGFRAGLPLKGQWPMEEIHQSSWVTNKEQWGKAITMNWPCLLHCLRFHQRDGI